VIAASLKAVPERSVRDTEKRAPHFSVFVKWRARSRNFKRSAQTPSDYESLESSLFDSNEKREGGKRGGGNFNRPRSMITIHSRSRARVGGSCTLYLCAISILTQHPASSEDAPYSVTEDQARLVSAAIIKRNELNRRVRLSREIPVILVSFVTLARVFLHIASVTYAAGHSKLERALEPTLTCLNVCGEIHSSSTINY
jgi:hypothetical protein